MLLKHYKTDMFYSTATGFWQSSTGFRSGQLFFTGLDHKVDIYMEVGSWWLFLPSPKYKNRHSNKVDSMAVFYTGCELQRTSVFYSSSVSSICKLTRCCLLYGTVHIQKSLAHRTTFLMWKLNGREEGRRGLGGGGWGAVGEGNHVQACYETTVYNAKNTLKTLSKGSECIGNFLLKGISCVFKPWPFLIYQEMYKADTHRIWN